jgi:hypothetical protein
MDKTALLLVFALVGPSVDLTPEGATVTEACATEAACIARVRQVAEPEAGISPQEEAVAKKVQSLGPDAVAPTLELLQDPDKKVRELAGYTSCETCRGWRHSISLRSSVLSKRRTDGCHRRSHRSGRRAPSGS